MSPPLPMTPSKETATTTVGSTKGTRSADHSSLLPRNLYRANSAAPGSAKSTQRTVEAIDSQIVNHRTLRIVGSATTSPKAEKSHTPSGRSPRRRIATTGQAKNTARKSSGGAAARIRHQRNLRELELALESASGRVRTTEISTAPYWPPHPNRATPAEHQLALCISRMCLARVCSSPLGRRTSVQEHQLETNHQA